MSRYTAFTDQSVFQDQQINLVGNIIYDAAIVEFNAKTVGALLAITGTTAKIIQGQATTEVKNLAFITSDAEIFSYFKANIKQLVNADRVILLKKTIQIVKGNFHYEIHKADTARTINLVNGLYVQDSAEIPSNIL